MEEIIKKIQNCNSKIEAITLLENIKSENCFNELNIDELIFVFKKGHFKNPENVFLNNIILNLIKEKKW